jgi:hypothetical protein
LHDEVTAAFNSLKFMEGVNQRMRVDIDEKLETLKAFNATNKKKRIING